MSNITDINSYPTIGQLERTISQQVRSLYRSQFGHQPSKVDCHLLGNKIVISVDDVITPIEKLLFEGKSSGLSIQVRAFIDETIKPKLRKLIEDISQVNVVSCFYDTAVETGCAGAIFILASPPQVRPRTKSKFKQV